MSLGLWRILNREEKENHDIDKVKGNTNPASLWLGFFFFAQTLSLTLCGFELLLQRHQLQSEELSHLLILLSLPEIKIQSHSQLFEYNAVGTDFFLSYWTAL